MRWSLVALAALAIAGGYAVSRGVGAESAQLAHGKYLVQLGGCTDCHTPGHLLGKPDMSRFLAGSDVGLEFPAWACSLLRISRPRTSSFCATELSALLRKPAPRSHHVR